MKNNHDGKADTPKVPALPRPALTRLPESAHCFNVMEQQDMLVGSMEGSGLITHEFFEHTMNLDRFTMRYKTEIMKLRELLIERGFYLAERGNNGKGYNLIPIPSTESQLRLWERKIINHRCRQIRLSRAVLAQHAELLSPEQKLRLQKAEESAGRMLAFESNKAATKRIMNDLDDKLRGVITTRAEKQIEQRTADDADADPED